MREEYKELRRIFGRNLRRLRLERGWSIEDLARRAGWSFATIACYEQGKFLPSAARLHRLARVLGCHIDELFKKNC
ncbi:MAG: helix-turn-helix domain-containing protein [Desulfotomaculales bacterium]